VRRVGLLEEKGVSTWQSAGAVDKTEWVSQIRTVATVFGPYQLQEGIHPTTGVSWRRGAVSASPTTAATCAADAACGRSTALPAVSRSCS
jgi:hypothetical protein